MATFVKTAATFYHGSHTLEREYFTSDFIFAEEKRRLFHGSWVCVGREDEVAGPGAYRVVDLVGESIIILRDAESRLRAFYNVCRHRGARLCEDAAGRLNKTIQCAYHGWTYGLDGRLLGAPHMQSCDGFAREDYPLHAAAIGVWDGFIFVNAAGGPEPLERWLAPLIGRFSRFNVASLRSVRRIEYDVAANWKLLFQNYSECMHCPTIHPELSARSPYTSGENDLTQGPFLGGFMVLSEPGGSLTVSGGKCALPVGSLPPEDMGRVYYYSILPNLLLSLHPDYLMFHTLWPETPGRTRIVCEWLFHPAAADSPDFRPDDAIEFWDRTNRQDWHVCESSQAGVASRAYTPGPYSPRESLSAAWDREYRRIVNDPHST